MQKGVASSSLAADPRWPFWVHSLTGPATAVGMASLLFWSRHWGHPVPNPNLIFALILVVAAYMGGLTSGLVTALIALLFTAYDWAIPGRLLTYSPDNLRRLVVAALCMPSMAIVVGLLKSKAESQRKAITRYLDMEKERNHQLALALRQVEHPEGSLPICAWCHKTREDDGHWTSLEDHLSKNYGTLITHGICPECRPAFHGRELTPKSLEEELPARGVGSQPFVGPHQRDDL